jgi:hypothetical protein
MYLYQPYYVYDKQENPNVYIVQVIIDIYLVVVILQLLQENQNVRKLE